MRRPVALVLLGALVLGACGSDAETPDSAAPAYRVEPSCPHTAHHLQGLTVAQLNRIVASADLPAWKAADIGSSAQLRDGRMVWVFGDTVRADSFSPRLVANSMLISDGACVAQLRTDADGPVIPDVRDGVVHWPMSVVAMPPAQQYSNLGIDEVLVVMAARTRRGGDNLDFQFLGTSAAVFTLDDGGAPQLMEVMEVTPDDEALDQVNWGAAATVFGPWFYVFGTRATGEDFGRELYVGRARVSDPADRSRWEFWDGTDWQADQTLAAPVLPAQGGVSQTLSVDHLDGKWVAVSKRDGDLGDFVYVWTAPEPFGPWTPRKGIAAPAGFDTGELQYAPLAHPEVPLSNGKLLVSISRNTTDPQQLFADPEVGLPEFAEVARP
ncbi:DUF4185 domain-containing protein [Nocardioides sp. SR21]|uniref:DUF4185 domain-containing protein n=1 Tax=Nocardioides sp. SR21 TaxID=2919501 RepID=UPI001FA96498|nr:DUF4185 domain-containing protein [Nocardioides sp. SR21]